MFLKFPKTAVVLYICVHSVFVDVRMYFVGNGCVGAECDGCTSSLFYSQYDCCPSQASFLKDEQVKYGPTRSWRVLGRIENSIMYCLSALLSLNVSSPKKRPSLVCLSVLRARVCVRRVIYTRILTLCVRVLWFAVVSMLARPRLDSRPL